MNMPLILLILSSFLFVLILVGAWRNREERRRNQRKDAEYRKSKKS